MLRCPSNILSTLFALPIVFAASTARAQDLPEDDLYSDPSYYDQPAEPDYPSSSTPDDPPPEPADEPSDYDDSSNPTFEPPPGEPPDPDPASDPFADLPPPPAPPAPFAPPEEAPPPLTEEQQQELVACSDAHGGCMAAMARYQIWCVTIVERLVDEGYTVEMLEDEEDPTDVCAEMTSKLIYECGLELADCQNGVRRKATPAN